MSSTAPTTNRTTTTTATTATASATATVKSDIPSASVTASASADVNDINDNIKSTTTQSDKTNSSTNTKRRPTREQIDEEFSKLRIPHPPLNQSSTTEQQQQQQQQDQQDQQDHEQPQPPTQQYDHSIAACDAQRLKREGNNYYAQQEYDKAIDLYSLALTSPYLEKEDRAIFLANRAACHLKLQKFQLVIDDSTEALRYNPDYTKALKRRKEAHECLTNWSDALNDAKQLNLDQSQIDKLTFKAEQKRKDDTKQAIDGLKGLGNSILSNFGMSLDDFQVEQNPDGSGSYSVKMNN